MKELAFTTITFIKCQRALKSQLRLQLQFLVPFLLVLRLMNDLAIDVSRFIAVQK